MTLHNLYHSLPVLTKLDQALEQERNFNLVGLEPTAKALLLGYLLPRLGKPFLYLASSQETAEKIYTDLSLFIPPEEPVLFFPEREKQLYDEKILAPGRMEVLQELIKPNPVSIVTTLDALLTPTSSFMALKERVIRCFEGQELKPEDLSTRLESSGYQKTALVQTRGEYAKRGGIVDVFPINSEPVRLEYWGDTIESIRALDIETQRSYSKIAALEILPLQEEAESSTLLDYLPVELQLILGESEKLEFNLKELAQISPAGVEQFKAFMAERPALHFSPLPLESLPHLDLPSDPLPLFQGKIEDWLENLKYWSKQKYRILIASQQIDRLENILSHFEIPGLLLKVPKKFKARDLVIVDANLRQGVNFKPWDLIVLTDKEIFGNLYRQTPKKVKHPELNITLESLKLNELVVHLQYGIGKFLGVQQIAVGDKVQDYLTLEYQKGDKLYVPVDQLDLLQKYIGIEGKPPNLSHLGGKLWVQTQKKVKEASQELALKLLELQQRRQNQEGFNFSPDTIWQTELEASFPYEETKAQLKALEEIKSDMESSRPMDRLVCGDAGYGKTEVALRAAFKAAVNHKQVAVIVPTTVLAQQHFGTFSSRLAPFPLRVEMLSRFKTPQEQKTIVQDLKTGVVDIVVGTHRLLQKDIDFKDLGLVILDEEQRFGVMHKERLKEIKSQVDVLTLTATPLPRTLHLSMLGIKELSLIDIPPRERLPVKTYLFPAQPDIIKGAVQRELDRGGQVFFLTNRVAGIERLAQDLRRSFPATSIGVAHGQMPETELEDAMIDFMQGNYQILVCTSIIENGIDIPNANTIIINNAHMFGIGQLYQLRGRVGRWHRQAYAYLLYPPGLEPGEPAFERLEVLKEFSHLGAGFQLAMRDLEIRGAGELLGAEQHGHIANVGFTHYCELLKEGIAELKAPQSKSQPTVSKIDLALKAYLPDRYVEDFNQKIELYQRMSRLKATDEVNDLREELKDRYGTLPPETENLLQLLILKLMAQKSGVKLVQEKEGRIFVHFTREHSLKDLSQLLGKLKVTKMQLDNLKCNFSLPEFEGAPAFLFKFFKALKTLHPEA